jgi:enoyl-CoA hydratase/carnithine racemase
MCDITICSEDAIVYDLHYDIGSVPGDGIHSCFLELLGVKRGAYALFTGEAIDAKKALEYGLVNEVVPRDKIIERAIWMPKPPSRSSTIRFFQGRRTI